jgi:regulator of protease activity HflC (stomatin/prohibitin superfamily)
MGLGFALAFTVLPLLTIATVASLWVLAVARTYGVTRRQAVCLMISLILKINQPIWIVENGEYKESEPKGWPPKIGGPGLVIIRPYNAVIFEQAGRVTRIEGPGEVRLNFDERIKAVIDLRVQSGGFAAENVLTRDRVPLKIVGGAGFRLQRTDDVIPRDPNLQAVVDATRAELSFLIAGRDSQQGSQDASRVMRRSVYNAVYGTKTSENWIDRTKSDAESEIRKVIRTYDFKEIYNLDEAEWDDPEVRETVLEEITRKVTDRLRISARRYGVHVLGASIKTIQIEDTENIGKAYFAALGAEWRKRLTVTEAEAEGAAFNTRARAHSWVMEIASAALEQFRQALLDMPASAQPLSKEILDRYMQVVERLLQNATLDHTTAKRYLETMETLARVSPNTVIAAGMDLANMADYVAPMLKPRGKE